jgi:hypothetical protein
MCRIKKGPASSAASRVNLHCLLAVIDCPRAVAQCSGRQGLLFFPGTITRLTGVAILTSTQPRVSGLFEPDKNFWFGHGKIEKK